MTHVSFDVAQAFSTSVSAYLCPCLIGAVIPNAPPRFGILKVALKVLRNAVSNVVCSAPRRFPVCRHSLQDCTVVRAVVGKAPCAWVVKCFPSNTLLRFPPLQEAKDSD